MLKGIIGYSDYSLALAIFECFKSNGIFVFLFKASHLATSAVCLPVFYYIMDIQLYILDFEDTHVTPFSNYFAINVFCN